MIDGQKAQLQSKLTMSVGFDETSALGLDVAATLQQIREYIGIYMLPAVALFFGLVRRICG